MKENLEYLKDVLGVRYVGKTKKKAKTASKKYLSQKLEDKTLNQVAATVSGCQDCKLCKTRTNTVFGSGSNKARLMFIGEGPGADEDAQGLPFVGRAGQLLTKMIEAMGLQRSEVYIANVVKCRPPENRKPEKDEVEACEGFLFKQIELIKPDLMIALGATAMECLLKTEEKIGQKRGQILDYRDRKLLITYHPAYLLRNPPAKKYVWDDLKVAMKFLGL